MHWDNSKTRNATVGFFMAVGFSCFIIAGLSGIIDFVYLGYIILYITMMFALDIF
jgi:hypothetical protein